MLTIVFSALCLFVLVENQVAHPYLRAFLVGHLFTSVSFLVLTLFTIPFGWKISVHTGSAAYIVAIGLLLFGVGKAVIAGLVFLILIGWSRLYLRRHTFMQVLLGPVLSTAILMFFFQNSGL